MDLAANEKDVHADFFNGNYCLSNSNDVMFTVVVSVASCGTFLLTF